MSKLRFWAGTTFGRGVQKLCRRRGCWGGVTSARGRSVSPLVHGVAAQTDSADSTPEVVALDVYAADLVFARAREVSKSGIDRVRLRVRIRGSGRRVGHGDRAVELVVLVEASRRGVHKLSRLPNPVDLQEDRISAPTGAPALPPPLRSETSGPREHRGRAPARSVAPGCPRSRGSRTATPPGPRSPVRAPTPLEATGCRSFQSPPAPRRHG